MKTKRFSLDRHGLLKLKTLLNMPKYVTMTSGLEKLPYSVCPMTLQHMDEQGNLWFITSKLNAICTTIQFDNRVQVIYNDPNSHNCITIFGTAEPVNDTDKMSELWIPLMYAWFKVKDNSELMLVRLKIETADYWDNQNNKLVSFFMNSQSRFDHGDKPVIGSNQLNSLELQ
ncbi:pyridoxamine 5'-phosphate oxidase family protein [Arenibacter algicola]|uniref:pyridoxamine 5'-phosphate oxidase family protein n=1 Tax=Arenibacter algicola TaxID=616991 RepID=UPI001C07BB0B|nr:pyridoxamine 5'-phosphate oxidase family protein [Arenibacter algicola]MBU2905917.1 pyridoxamine 5'-phosphate oxidase family protein [Arenibacter algicola]